MKRIEPPKKYNGLPCSMVSVLCAVGDANDKAIGLAVGLRNDGYLTLKDMNKYIRSCMDIRKRQDFKRGERKTLQDFLSGNKEKGIICVRGHYIYVEGETYYSFFDNDMDEVITVWWIK